MRLFYSLFVLSLVFISSVAYGMVTPADIDEQVTRLTMKQKEYQAIAKTHANKSLENLPYRGRNLRNKMKHNPKVNYASNVGFKFRREAEKVAKKISSLNKLREQKTPLTEAQLTSSVSDFITRRENSIE